MAQKRILVVLPNWFGETLFATPFIHALARGLPETMILTLGWPQCRQILSFNPDVRHMIDHPERNWLDAWRAVRFVNAARADAAVILRKSLSRTLITALAGVRHRVGFDHPKVRWLLTDRVEGPDEKLHKAMTYMALLAPLGVKEAFEPYRYCVTDDERGKIKRWLTQEGLRQDAPLVVVHPGANWEHKRWRPERFAMVADLLIEKFGVRIGITGTAADRDLVASVQQHMRHPANDWSGALTVRQLAACLEQARLLISNDTGVLHLAAAVRCPVVGLYGPTSPALTGPLGPPERVRVVHSAKSCPKIPCFAPDWPPHPGMDAVEIEDVARAAADLLIAG